MKNPINKKILIDLGYKEWKKNNFQKRVKDSNNNRMYFINILHSPRIKGQSVYTEWWTFKFCFENCKPHGGTIHFEFAQWFNGNYGEKSVEEVEEIIHNIWVQNGSPYYEFI